MSKIAQQLKSKRKDSKKQCDKLCDTLDILIVSAGSNLELEMKVEEVIEWVKEIKDLIKLKEANEQA